MPPRRSHAQWQKMMDQFSLSNLTQEQFCRSKGVALATFTMWRRKLKATTAMSPAPPAFVEVHVPRGTELLRTHSPEPADLVVELPYGVVLKFRGLAQ